MLCGRLARATFESVPQLDSSALLSFRLRAQRRPEESACTSQLSTFNRVWITGNPEREICFRRATLHYQLAQRFGRSSSGSEFSGRRRFRAIGNHAPQVRKKFLYHTESHIACHADAETDRPISGRVLTSRLPRAG